MKVSVSFTKYTKSAKETIFQINETSADYIHIDLMDGKFVETKQQLPSELDKVISHIKKPLDVHLMAVNPDKYLSYFASLNTEYITFHLEAVNNPEALIDKIHFYGLKCGLCIKPETKVEVLLPFLDKIEQVLIMSVEPGLGGQSFLMGTSEKITWLKNLNKNNFIVSVDGGINDETISYVRDADMVVSGSYICLSENYQKAIDSLKG